MPIVKLGPRKFRWETIGGFKGKTYSTRRQAVEQAQAAHSAGYVNKTPAEAARDKARVLVSLAKAIEKEEHARAVYRRFPTALKAAAVQKVVAVRERIEAKIKRYS